MNLSLNYLADQFVFWNLRKISYGYLELIDYKGMRYLFGNKESPLKAQIKINSNEKKISLKNLNKSSTHGKKGNSKGYEMIQNQLI